MSEETEDSLATRPSLLARLKDWSQHTAWREFGYQYAPLLRNLARKAGLSENEADDVTQETLIAVAKKIEDFEHNGRRGSFRAWLYQQIRWRIADQFRARRRANLEVKSDSVHRISTVASAGEDIDGASPEGERVFERIWDSEWEQHIQQCALARIKQRVSLKQFQLFDLHVLQGLPVRDAAHAAGSTMAAVYMAKSRIGRLLKSEVVKLSH